ncbi:MAG: TonB-dependent receptor [Acidobacteria bacterium]|nr:TonB-dependent receptor [Acidobacteriota bacterium]
MSRRRGNQVRSNWAAYTDLETDVIARLTLGVAVRYEDFSDFGNTFNGKVSGRFELNKRAAVRASANTGFRAPTPGQSNITEVATNIDPLTGGLLLVATLPPTNAIGQFYGARSLTPEKSVNWSGGLVFNLLDGYALTLDYFDIRVEDRIALTSRIPVTAADRAGLTARGVDPGDFQSVRFFGNFFDSRTRGVDVVVAKTWALSGASRLGATAAFNHTRNKVTDVRDARAIDRERRIEISDFNPRGRGNFALDYGGRRWQGRAVVSYYGRWTDAVPNAVPTAVSFDQTFPAESLVDLEAGYRFAGKLTLSVGAENVFNTYPDEDLRLSQRNNGLVYPQFSPFGFSGRFFYLRAAAKF